MNVKETIDKLFDGLEASRVNFITNVFMEKGLDTVDKLKTLDSDFWESLRGLEHVDLNNTWSFAEKVEEATKKALEGSHVSRINFFAEVLKENLELKDLKRFGCKHLYALKKLTKPEIYEIRRVVKKKFEEEEEKEEEEEEEDDDDDDDDDDDESNGLHMFRNTLNLKKKLKRYGEFKLKEALRELTGNEIKKFEEKVQYCKSFTRPSFSECMRPIGEFLAEIFEDQNDPRISSIAEALKKYMQINLAYGLIHSNLKYSEDLRENDEVYFKLETSLEKKLEELIAEALEGSGKLRINFVTKALIRLGLWDAYNFFSEEGHFDDLLRNLEIIQEFTNSEISNFVGFTHKSIKEVISEILDGCNDSKIDFITKDLNRIGIFEQIHLIEMDNHNRLRYVQGLSENEVNKIKEFIKRVKDLTTTEILTEMIKTDKRRTSYLKNMLESRFASHSPSFGINWKSLEVLMGLNDLEINKFMELIQISLGGLTDVEINKIRRFLEIEMAVEMAVTEALEGSHESRINFFKEVLKNNFDVTDLKQLDKKYMGALKRLSKTEIHEIREYFSEIMEEHKNDFYKLIRTFGDDDDDNNNESLKFWECISGVTHFSWEIVGCLKEATEFEKLKKFQNLFEVYMPIEGVLNEIFKESDSSLRIDAIAEVLRRHHVFRSGCLDCFDFGLLHGSQELSIFEINRIKNYALKRQEMTIEEVLAEILDDPDDDRIKHVADVFKEFHDVYMARNLWKLSLSYGSDMLNKRCGVKEFEELRKQFEKALEQAVASTLKDSGVLRIKFVTKALMRNGLGNAYKYLRLKLLDGSHPLDILHDLSDSEISKIMAFVRKSLKEVLAEILKGCDDSRIDFVTKILNKEAIWNQLHLIEIDHELLQGLKAQGLKEDEIYKITTFYKDTLNDELLTRRIFGFSDVKRINFISFMMEKYRLGLRFCLSVQKWESIEALMGLNDIEVEKFLELVQKTQYIESIRCKRKNQMSDSLELTSTNKRRKIPNGLLDDLCLIETSESNKPREINYPTFQQINEPLTWDNLKGIEHKFEVVNNKIEFIENKLNNVLSENATLKKMLEELLQQKNNGLDRNIDDGVLDSGQMNFAELPTTANTQPQIVKFVAEGDEIREGLNLLNWSHLLSQKNLEPITNNNLFNLHLPIKTNEEFHSVEMKLNESQDFHKSLVKMISKCGGSNVKNAVFRIMKMLLSHDLTLNMTWSGKVPGKIGFQSSKLMGAVTDAVRMNPKTSTAMDEECEAFVKSWLRNAPDRYGGRNKRRERRNADL